MPPARKMRAAKPALWLAMFILRKPPLNNLYGAENRTPSAARIEGGGRMADSPLKCVQSYRGIHLIIRAPLNITRGSLTQT